MEQVEAHKQAKVYRHSLTRVVGEAALSTVAGGIGMTTASEGGAIISGRFEDPHVAFPSSIAVGLACIYAGFKLSIGAIRRFEKIVSEQADIKTRQQG